MRVPLLLTAIDAAYQSLCGKRLHIGHKQELVSEVVATIVREREPLRRKSDETGVGGTIKGTTSATGKGNGI